MDTTIQSKPLIGWGNRYKKDENSTATLLDSSPLVSFTPVPTLENAEWGKNLWWTVDLSEVGIRAKDLAVSWNPRLVHSYHVDISYPSRGDGYCALAILPRPLQKFEYSTLFHCVRFPYSSASLEILIALTASLSQLSLGPVTYTQWTDC